MSGRGESHTERVREGETERRREGNGDGGRQMAREMKGRQAVRERQMKRRREGWRERQRDKVLMQQVTGRRE